MNVFISKKSQDFESVRELLLDGGTVFEENDDGFMFQARDLSDEDLWCINNALHEHVFEIMEEMEYRMDSVFDLPDDVDTAYDAYMKTHHDWAI